MTIILIALGLLFMVGMITWAILSRKDDEVKE